MAVSYGGIAWQYLRRLLRRTGVASGGQRRRASARGGNLGNGGHRRAWRSSCDQAGNGFEMWRLEKLSSGGELGLTAKGLD